MVAKVVNRKRKPDEVFASATSSGAVTKSDTTELYYKALYVGGAGDITIKHNPADSAVTYAGLLAGSILPVEGRLVMSTNTTATNIVWMNW